MSLVAAASYAQNKVDPKQDPKAYTLDESSVRIQVLGPSLQADIGGIPSPTPTPAPAPKPGPTPAPAPAPSPIKPPLPIGGDGTDPFVVIDQMINLGQKIWSIIEANKPVVNVQTQYATALPQGITSWGQLAGWKPPEGSVYGFSAKNAYGIKVIDVSYQVLRTYGGNYNGKGKFLTAVTIQPLSVNVAWGYTFNMTVEIPDTSIVNVGTTQDPVAAMQPLVKWTVSTALKSSSGQSTYYVQGDGLFKELSGPFTMAYQDGAAKALDSAAAMKF
jgi:hypothetical protein